MAGGVGSRFWPASRESLPKQFLDILGVGRSLIQLTYDRAVKLVPKEHILIATHQNYKALVHDHLPDIAEKQILLEPSRNNTAPCIAYASLKIHALDPSAVFGVWPADHVILKEDVFIDKMKLAFEFAAINDVLLTLGIMPTRPDTGYGYIEVNHRDGANEIEQVVSFKEKPTLAKAKEYLKAKNYFWNAGIFIWSTASVIRGFREHTSPMIELLSEELSAFNTDRESSYINRVYPMTEKISVDYALLERSANVYTIPADIAWSDLGTWNSLYDYLEKDSNANVIQAKASITEASSKNFIQLPGDKLIVLKGLSNYIIIDRDDVLLIWPKSEEQEIKRVRGEIREERYL